MARQMAQKGLLAGVVFGIFISPAAGLTIRDDRSDSQYTQKATTVLPQGGSVTGPGWIGSGSLISPTWVLTAGHVASGTATTFSSPLGTRSIINQYMYSGGDIGLAQLSSPITGDDPVPLYSVNLFGIEDGQSALIAGAGNTGTGITGQQGGTAGAFRAAQTDVYANASAWGWSGDDLLTWFHSPSNGAADLEGGSAQGDSGGGLFLNVGGTWSIAGVLSQAWYTGGAESIGKYDSGGVFIRTGTLPVLNWILSYAADAQVVPEPASVSVLGLAGLIIIRRRVA